jgi:hypothetical protein
VVKLIIGRTREEITNFIGRYKDSKFVLRCQLDLTEGEAALVRRCQLGDYPIRVEELNGVEIPTHTISTLRAGLSFTVTDPASVIHYTRDLKQACKELLLVLDLYGQRDSYEYEKVVDYS